MSGGGGGGDSTQTVINDPWSAQQPYLTKGFSKAQNLLYAGGPAYYNKQNYTNPSAQTTTALNNLWNRGAKGNAVMNMADSSAYKTLRGDYLSPGSNPYLKATYDQALQQALPSLNATFSAAGRTGADAQVQGMADTYGALSRDIYGQNYQNERDRQMQAMAFAPQSAAADYQDLQARLGVGQAKDAQAQKVLDANMQKWNFNQERPYDALQRYMSVVGGNQWGGTQTSQTPQQGSNPFGGAMGGALSGAALGSVVPGLGTAWGAGLGGAMGLLGGIF